MAGSTNAWRWHHTGLTVDDLDRAIAYHRDTLGFELVFEVRGLTELIRSVTGTPELTVDLAQLRCPYSEQLLELLAYSDVPDSADPGLPLQPGTAHVAYLVEDLDASLAALERAGGRRFGRITTFAEGRGVYCRTPVGSTIELLEATPDGPHDPEV